MIDRGYLHMSYGGRSVGFPTFYSVFTATIGGASPWRRWINFFGNEPKPPNKIRLLANSRATCI